MYPAAVYPSPPPWPQGLNPQRAPVKPRVRSVPGGEALPLEGHVIALLQSKARGVVSVFGPAGSGKTCALQHLAAALGPREDLCFADNRYPAWVDAAAEKALVLFTSREKRPESVHAFEMSPWTQDEIIEYLLAVHREQCSSVMQRVLSGSDRHELPGLPELWRPLLDLLAADASVMSCGNALRKLLWSYAADPGARTVLASFCLGLLAEGKSDADVETLVNDTPGALRLARYRPVQVFVAAEAIAADLEAGRGCPYLRTPLPRDVVRETGMLLAKRPAARQRLEHVLIVHDRALHPAAASLLFAADPHWRPREQGIPNLAGAKLQCAQWPGVRLWGADLSGADLSEALLTTASLPDANLRRANLSIAKLSGAWLERVHADEANLSCADLTGVRADFADFSRARLAGARLAKARLKHAIFQSADLSKVILAGADLSHARLEDATITDADFADCCLDHASMAGLSLRLACFRNATFRGTNLVGADLEGVKLDSADFRCARLVNADLTNSSLPNADFSNADLREALLAEIDWAGADLSEADLRGASFHLGSTRSGLVPGAGIPSEGTRTGFYTDDYEEHRHRPPEQIRHANLRGADLIGARVEDTDFYLVDLRDAQYTEEQHHHFRRCRAIL